MRSQIIFNSKETQTDKEKKKFHSIEFGYNPNSHELVLFSPIMHSDTIHRKKLVSLSVATVKIQF